MEGYGNEITLALMLMCHKVAYKKLIFSPPIPNKHC